MQEGGAYVCGWSSGEPIKPVVVTGRCTLRHLRLTISMMLAATTEVRSDSSLPRRIVGKGGSVQGIVGNLTDELTSSQRASSEEAEQTDASMLERETNNNT